MATLSANRGSILALLLAVAFAAPARADGGVQLFEQAIEAGLLYNFIKYTQWPQEHAAPPNGNVVVCLLGGDPFNGHLQPMVGRTVNQRRIEIRNVKGPQEAEACALLFVHANERSNWPQLQRKLSGRGILTVSDFDTFAESGGMIEFTRTDNRIGVKINIDAVTSARLAVQPRLLRLASLVHAAPE